MKTISAIATGLLLCLYACQNAPDRNASSLAPLQTAADSAQLLSRANAWLEAAENESTKAERIPLLLDSAWAGYRALGHKENWLEAVNLYRRYYYSDTLYDQAQLLLDRAIAEAWWGEDGLKGRLYLWQGYTLRQLGRNYAAAAYYEKAKDLSDRYGNVSVRNDPAGDIYKTLANIKTRLGENEEAEKLLLAALRILDKDTAAERRQQRSITRANIYSDLGTAYQTAENYPKAMEQFQAGLAVLDREEAYSAAVSNARGLLLSGVAAMLLMEGQPELAEKKIRAALDTLPPKKINYRFSAYTILADIQERAGNYAAASQTLETALALADGNAGAVEEREVAKLVNTIGWMAFAQNDYAAALHRAQEALHRLFPKNIDAGIYTHNPAPSWIALDPENAVAEALDLKGEALWQLYQTGADPARLDLAGQTTDLAIQMMENLRDVAVYESSKLQSTQQSRRLFNRMMRLLYAREKTGDKRVAERAFEYAERSKAVLLRQKLAADAALAKAGLPNALIQQDRELKEQWAALKNDLFKRQMAGKPIDDSIATNISQRLFQIENDRRALHQQISATYQIELDDRQTPTATVADVQKKILRSGESWMTYFTDRDSNLVYAIAVDKNGIRWVRQPYREAEVQAFIQDMNNVALAENRSGDPELFAGFVRRSRQLYQTLLEPVLPGGAVPKRLALAPDGALALLPFDVLLCQAGPANTAEVDYAALPFLVKFSQTRIVPSASLELFHANGRPASRRGSYIGFAPDYSGSSLGQVVSGASVVEESAAAFDGEAFVGQAAGLEAFLNKAGGYAIIHFHGHAEASDSFPDYSWMAFTASGQPIAQAHLPTDNFALTLSGRPGRISTDELPHCLFAHQVYQAHLGADLVLLSACKTGLGKIALGEGTLSLSRAFQAAGCPATVMSLWEVRDDATAELMRLFLENIRRGQDKDEALTNAKRSYLNSAGDPFPYYWAGFVLTGKADPVRLSGRWWEQAGLLILLIGAAGAAIGWVVLRRRRTKR